MSRADRNLALMRTDTESDWVDRLLHDIAQAPEVRTVATPAELRVLERLSHGDTPRQAAKALHLALSTVVTHVRNAKAAMGTRSTIESCCEAVRLGLIP